VIVVVVATSIVVAMTVAVVVSDNTFVEIPRTVLAISDVAADVTVTPSETRREYVISHCS
jgi:hypothetical protein